MGSRDQDECLGLDVATKWDICSCSDVDNDYFTQRIVSSRDCDLFLFDEKNLVMVRLSRGNAFRPDNNVEIAPDQNGIRLLNVINEFLGSFIKDLSAWEWQEHMEKLNNRYAVTRPEPTSQIPALD